MIKKLITSLTISVMLLTVGCQAISTWWKDLNLTDIANTLAPTIQAASKYGTFAICDKNKDLRPIFIASANGVKIAANDNAFSTEQIKIYIKQALGTENEKWAPVVYAAMDTVLAQYNIIYEKYINKQIEDNDKVNGFKIMLVAMATGIVEGASMEDLNASLKASIYSAEAKRIAYNKQLKEEVAKY